MVTASGVNLANIQGNVFRGYRFAVAAYLFFRIDDADRARRWLQDILGHVTNSEPWEDKPDSTVNIAFSYNGFRALGLPPETLQSFAPEFIEGMASRAALLSDVGESAPDHWDAPLGTPDVHIHVAFNAQHAGAMEDRMRWLDETLARSGGVTLIYCQNAAALPNRAEHFGYIDGFGQPSMTVGTNPPLPGQGTVDSSGGWTPLQPGEFLLGHPDNEGLQPAAPTPHVLAQDGTYLVFRKLYERPAEFRSFLREQAQWYGGSEELLAAKIIGRWRDGTPIMLSPDRPDPAIAGDERQNDNFRYSDDPEGLRCPIGAHIRRANPRDGGLGTIPQRHRIIRRGLAYGPPLPEGAPDDGEDRGIIFIALNSSILRQFEFVLTQWVNDGNIFGLGRDKDCVVANQDGSGMMTVPGSPPFFLAPLRPLVVTRGGEYFFMPGIEALRWLASAESRAQG